MYTTPGVYFETVDRSRPAVGPLRTDIAAFIGYAERGPLLVPIKVTGWRQFTATFGGPLPDGYLAYAVRGFFENGGVACYIVRVADEKAAQAATVTLLEYADRPSIFLYASYGELHDAATNAPQIEDERPIHYPNPGAWANRLSISLTSHPLGTTAVTGRQPDDGMISYVAGLSGFQEGSVVRFFQNGVEASQYRLITETDAHRQQILWNQPLVDLTLPDPHDATVEKSFDVRTAFDLETVEFSLFVHLDGQIIERHEGLSLSAKHRRYIGSVLQDESHVVAAKVWADLEQKPEKEEEISQRIIDPAYWPKGQDRAPLTGGYDGVNSVTKKDFITAIELLAHVDEVSILAAPDLVLRPTPLTVRPRARTDVLPCKTLATPPQGRLRGEVFKRGTDVKLGRVRAQALESASPSVLADGDGIFTLEQLPVGRVTVILKYPGYYDTEITAQSRLVLPEDPENPNYATPFFMVPIESPPALPLDDIFDVQEAMIRQGERGFYRVALLDPPPEALSLEHIQTWRSRFDSAYGALYYPWLMVTREDSHDVIRVPPSGHVAGLIARTDLHEGVHRAPANAVLFGVKALTETVDDAQHGILNPLHINSLRLLPGRGIRVYGARTLSSNPEWRYLNVRRLISMIEEAVEDASQWAVFEPNNQVLRQTLTFSLNGFLNVLWRQGALAGDAPEGAYQVTCDTTNNPPDVIDAGQIIAEIDVAPTIPFEFIRFRLGRTIEAVEVTE